MNSRSALLIGLTTCFLLVVGCDTKDPADPGGGDEPAFSMGVGLSPRGHTSGSTNQDWIDHYSGHAPWGRIIAFHGNWRVDVASAGETPSLALAAVSAAAQYGFTPAIGLGWTVGEGEPDLTSESDPQDNSWTNQETRDEYLAMVSTFAGEYKPRLLFLGNETNAYYNTHTAAEWAAWLSEYAACYDAVKAVSPNTIVYTTYQYEMLRGVGQHNGWSFPEDWQPVDDLVATGRLDAVGFTSYPYFEYDAPGDIPAGYYDAIAVHWTGPVIFSEIGWLGNANPPYSGGEAAQVEFIGRFFELTTDLELRYVVWLFLHDWDGEDAMPAFRSIGLRTNDGIPRQSDTVWRAEVTARE